MKIAILSDIHANLPALQAITRHIDSVMPDVVVVGGDVINRGPQPLEVLEIIMDRIRSSGWLIIKGNHEDYVLNASRGISHLPEWEQQVCAHTVWTARHVKQHLNEIIKWPDVLEVPAPDGSHLTCFHASRKGNRVGLYECMGEEDLVDHLHTIHSALCVGHTHVPFVRYVQGKLIVNAGSVGMSFDGNPDASYAIVEWAPGGWTGEIIRIPYDRQTTLHAYHDSGYIEQGGIMVKLIMQELQHAGPRLGKWHIRFERLVASGKITLEESVNTMLQEQ